MIPCTFAWALSLFFVSFQCFIQIGQHDTPSKCVSCSNIDSSSSDATLQELQQFLDSASNLLQNFEDQNVETQPEENAELTQKNDNGIMRAVSDFFSSIMPKISVKCDWKTLDVKPWTKTVIVMGTALIVASVYWFYPNPFWSSSGVAVADIEMLDNDMQYSGHKASSDKVNVSGRYITVLAVAFISIAVLGIVILLPFWRRFRRRQALFPQSQHRRTITSGIVRELHRYFASRPIST